MTVSIEIKNDGVLNLFSEMERLNLIRLNTPSPEAGSVRGKEPLSKQFAGALRLSDTAYEALQNSVQEGRNEWNRNIF
jgi:hypothetical protein